MVALAQPELAALLHRHVDVVAAGEEALDPQEAVALVAEVEQAVDIDRLALPLDVLLLDVAALAVAVATPAATTATVARLAVRPLVVAVALLVLLVRLVLLAAALAATLVLAALVLIALAVLAALVLAALTVLAALVLPTLTVLAALTVLLAIVRGIGDVDGHVGVAVRRRVGPGVGRLGEGPLARFGVVGWSVESVGCGRRRGIRRRRLVDHRDGAAVVRLRVGSAGAGATVAAAVAVRRAAGSRGLAGVDSVPRSRR